MGPHTGTLIPFQHQPETLTYESFFGLREKAFSLDSDPRFLYQSASHAATYENLLAGIRRREGMLVLTGEIGTGKTTLCRAVLRNLGRKTFSSFVPDPFASREDLLKMLLIDFGVMSIRDLTSGALQHASRAELSYLLAGFLESLSPLDAFVVVIIDEAQNMSLPMIEETRILFDSFGGNGRLQIVFVGQLELHSKLKLPEMRQVDQRICVYSRLAPLSRDCVAGYIQHRLQVAGRSREGELFSPDVIDILHRRTGGVPRLVNRVCDRALELAYRQEAASVGREIMETALIDVGATTLTPTWASIMFPEPEVMGTTSVSPQPAVATTAPTMEPIPSVEDDESFFKLVDEWAKQDLPKVSRRFTSLGGFQNEARERPAQQPSPGHRTVPAQSHSREVQGERSSETRRQSPRRASVKKLAIAVVCVAALSAAVFGVSRLPNVLADSMMTSPVLPALPAPPTLAVASLVSPEAPPMEAPIAPPTAGTADYLVSVGLFASRERADQLEIELTQAGLPAVQRPFQLRNQRLQQVVLGPFGSRLDAAEGLRALRLLGDYDDATVIDGSLEPSAP
jgi:type II secretory pathway predicted ATPase ExeA/cell division septation protein DedD